jgi:hypothetical protein
MGAPEKFTSAEIGLLLGFEAKIYRKKIMKNLPTFEEFINESEMNEYGKYKVTKNSYRDYDSLNITDFDRIQFKKEGDNWIVRCVTAHDNIDTRALQRLGFNSMSSSRYAGISHFTKDANWNDLILNNEEFDQLIKLVDAGWASHSKSFSDFYRNRQAD